MPALESTLPPALIEVFATFEASDPDACELLLPWEAGLNAGQIETRVRARHSTLPASARADLVARASALLEHVGVEAAQRPAKSGAPAGVTPVSKAERERRCALLAAEVERNPALTAEAARNLLAVELGTFIPKGTFYGGYWNRVLAGLGDETRRLREAMRAPRSGGRRLHLTNGQRDRVRQAVAVIKRDHPDWHDRQMMDEASRVTGFRFHDPVAFRRNYIERVAPAPVKRKRIPAPPAMVASPRVEARVRADDFPSSAVVPPWAEAGRGPREHSGALEVLVAAVDPFCPADLSPSEDGRVQVRLNLQPMTRSASHRLMSRLYAAMADLEEEVTSPSAET